MKFTCIKVSVGGKADTREFTMCSSADFCVVCVQKTRGHAERHALNTPHL